MKSLDKKSGAKRALSSLIPLFILVAGLLLLHAFGILTLDRDLVAVEMGLINSLVVLSLFLSYTMLNVCDLSTDGCYTLGVAVGGVVCAAGHPGLAIPAAMLAGACSGFITAILQTKMGVNSLLSGIIVNTGLYSINIVVMGKSIINVFKSSTVFSLAEGLFGDSPVAQYASIFVGGIAVILVITLLSFLLRTKLGMAIHATGDNPAMVRSSSINPATTTIIGLCISGSFTALSGCLFIQLQKSADINVGTGMVTMALASLLIGGVFVPEGPVPVRAAGAVLGAVIFRLIYAIALALKIDTNLLKLVYSVIVVLAISLPYLKTKVPEYKRRFEHRRKGGAVK